MSTARAPFGSMSLPQRVASWSRQRAVASRWKDAETWDLGWHHDAAALVNGTRQCAIDLLDYGPKEDFIVSCDLEFSDGVGKYVLFVVPDGDYLGLSIVMEDPGQAPTYIPRNFIASRRDMGWKADRPLGQGHEEQFDVAESILGIFAALLRSEYARFRRRLAAPRGGRTSLRRLQRSGTWRNTIKIDWRAFYETDPACRQDLPPGEPRQLPLHKVSAHWCERHNSGRRDCPHVWTYQDHHHRECSACGRRSWFRVEWMRGDPRFGVIVHDYDGRPEP